MSKERKPAQAKPSTAKVVKNLFLSKKKEKGFSLSLKQFARTLLEDFNHDQESASWLFNKRANFSNPPQGIGNTRRKKVKTEKKDK